MQSTPPPAPRQPRCRDIALSPLHPLSAFFYDGLRPKVDSLGDVTQQFNKPEVAVYDSTRRCWWAVDEINADFPDDFTPSSTGLWLWLDYNRVDTRYILNKFYSNPQPRDHWKELKEFPGRLKKGNFAVPCYDSRYRSKKAYRTAVSVQARVAKVMRAVPGVVVVTITLCAPSVKDADRAHELSHWLMPATTALVDKLTLGNAVRLEFAYTDRASDNLSSCGFKAHLHGVILVRESEAPRILKRLCKEWNAVVRAKFPMESEVLPPRCIAFGQLVSLEELSEGDVDGRATKSADIARRMLKYAGKVIRAEKGFGVGSVGMRLDPKDVAYAGDEARFKLLIGRIRFEEKHPELAKQKRNLWGRRAGLLHGSSSIPKAVRILTTGTPILASKPPRNDPSPAPPKPSPRQPQSPKPITANVHLRSSPSSSTPGRSASLMADLRNYRSPSRSSVRAAVKPSPSITPKPSSPSLPSSSRPGHPVRGVDAMTALRRFRSPRRRVDRSGKAAAPVVSRASAALMAALREDRSRSG